MRLSRLPIYRIPDDLVNILDAAWLAGVIDGDGSITVSVNEYKGWVYIYPRVVISCVTWPEIAYKIADLLTKWKIKFDLGLKKEGKMIEVLIASLPDVIALLSRIMPFLQAKRQLAELALELALEISRRRWRMRRLHKSIPPSKRELELALRIKRELARRNKRGGISLKRIEKAMDLSA